MTGIQWTDETWNPTTGCTKVSPACDHCYAEQMMEKRFHRVTWGAPGQGAGTRERTSEANWRKPLAWNREAAKSGKPRFVFALSLGDIFDNEVPIEWLRDAFGVIHATPALTWLLLTKRPGNIVSRFLETIDPAIRATWGPNSKAPSVLWPENAAIGMTICNQSEWDRDWRTLRDAQITLSARFPFVSFEPLLGPVNMMDTGWWPGWCITGGETNQGGETARPSNPEWFRSIRDQCAATGIPFHHKQNGEWAPISHRIPEPDPRIYTTPAVTWGSPKQTGFFYDPTKDDTVYYIGKEAAGRALDGAVHDARPEARA